jgi:hypothetical protein
MAAMFDQSALRNTLRSHLLIELASSSRMRKFEDA